MNYGIITVVNSRQWQVLMRRFDASVNDRTEINQVSNLAAHCGS